MSRWPRRPGHRARQPLRYKTSYVGLGLGLKSFRISPGSTNVNTPNKNLMATGPFSGLWVRTARTLATGGFQGEGDVRTAIASGKLRPFLGIRGYGSYAHREVLRWLSPEARQPMHSPPHQGEVLSEV